MKRFTSVVLMLCIAMMCTTPFEAQGQNRRTGGNTSNTTTKKEQSAQTKSSNSSSAAPRRTGSSGSNVSKGKDTPAPQNQNRTVKPSGQTRQGQSQQNKPAAKPQEPSNRNGHGNTAPAQVQDRRNNNVKPSGNSSSHSAQISRKNSDVGRQNIPAPKRETRPPRDVKPRDHKPAAVQYHNAPPKHRGPEYTRPYLEPRHVPAPSYRYGDHYFGHRIHALPRGYVTMRVGGIDYYYYDGIYYRPYLLGGYYVCRPPRGTTIASTLLNVALTAVAINTIRDEIARARRAATLSSVYGAANSGYVVRTSDDYYNTNLANQGNQEYYYQDGVFYILRNGQYYVIDAPIGALVTEIPADYDEIELDGRTYYQVENTLYKATVIDGALYFEVVCNL